MQILLAVTVFAVFFVELTAKKKEISDSVYTNKLKDSYSGNIEFDGENIFDLRGILRQRFGLIAAQSNPNNSSICSPMSALIPLGKLALGANSNASSSELKNAIGINVGGKSSTLGKHFSRVLNVLNNLPGVVLDLANRLYVSENHQLYGNYTRQIRKIFKSDVKKVDFNQPKKVAMNINKWVSSKTHEMISKLIPPNAITPQTSLVIVSAIYFSGKWKQPFEPSSLGPFYSPYGVRQVQMMSKMGRCSYWNSKVLSAQLLKIPYAGEGSSFLIVLPRRRNGLQSLLNLLNKSPKLLFQEMKKMQSTEKSLSMPKFTIESSWDLTKLYKQIGVKAIFNKRKSGLNYIVRNERIYVSSAIQKAVIEVTEQGTKASASSVVEMTNLSGSDPIIVDRPFLFYVLASNQQLFSGVYTGPSG